MTRSPRRTAAAGRASITRRATARHRLDLHPPRPHRQHREEPADPSVMTLVEHLSELRRRVFICVVAIVIGGVVGLLEAPATSSSLLLQPLDPYSGGRVVLLSLGSGFLLYLKIAIVAGIAIGLPVILYQLWAFVAPGPDGQHERAAPAAADSPERRLLHARAGSRLRHPALRRAVPGRLPDRRQVGPAPDRARPTSAS